MRAFAGLGDLLTGNAFDFDRRNEENPLISERRMISKMFYDGDDGDDDNYNDGRVNTSDVTTTRLSSFIGRPDLLEHQDQILKQLPKGTTIQDVIKGDIPGVTFDELTRILATSDAQKATLGKRKIDREILILLCRIQVQKWMLTSMGGLSVDSATVMKKSK